MALPAGRYGVTKRQLNKIKNLPVNTIGMIEESAEAVTNLTKNTIGWLTQNELKLPYYNSTVSGDITATVNSDGTVTLSSGTSSTQEILYIRYKSEEFNPDVGTYKISKGFTNGKIGLVCEGYNGDTWAKVLASSFSNDEVTFDIDYVGYDRISIYLNIQSGAVSEGITVVPVLEHLTVSELMGTKANVTALATKADITALGTQEGATASKLYHPSDHFYKDGKFCTVISNSNVAAGSTWILNTNYIEGTVADLLTNKISAVTEIVADAEVLSDQMGNHIYKYGNVVELCLTLKHVTCNAYTNICRIPEGYNPLNSDIRFTDSEASTRSYKTYNGYIQSAENLSDAKVVIHQTWITK